jgi:hypothetical protein
VAHSIVPPHLKGAEKPHEVACRNDFAIPLKPDQVDELRWYFERRRALVPTRSGSGERT